MMRDIEETLEIRELIFRLVGFSKHKLYQDLQCS